ncbi:UDP-N-acetylmuramoyl-tripeptide--D-alanyl-D-alanine ligase [Fructilactobacillus carniphilus]|uniref:UDP-N-acetylmuramoyl-tripeptide--D-alanyl-D-alanine ligase n=1 Tax=Fructilactobacillus carniphilus TaxID=2940297 RepID=A0ABY5BYN3_9LACO|nr:UDP-N-acetylmuramoyl-tripeptide--D-alanyl-D-alanine ligase [Fructilactobacillus carniphilus]USS90145.1 UDP-N-acetylmuramoyl-tripeptide--D-alanyl-D-alanine ligase [Fructilactobacillus carniphilus]
MKMRLDEIARAVEGELRPATATSLEVTSVAFDSRDLKPGALFVPLEGDRDGHDYIESAIDHGAVAALWAEERVTDAPADFPVIIVANPLASLQRLAKYYLAKINPKVVAVTGSNGKTTTKDLISGVVQTTFNVTKTQDNFNNEIGVPITILSMNSNTEVLVVEMGMDRPGQLHRLSELVNPDIAVITMIGEAHIEFFGTRAKIAEAKLEITDGLPDDGVFVYDGDEPLLADHPLDKDLRRFTFGRQGTNDIYPTQIEESDQATRFQTNRWQDFEFTIPLIGDYNVNNALAALSVGELLKVTPANLRSGLAHPNLTANRAEWVKGNQGELILSDVYNSNPTAVRAVLQAFSNTELTGKRIVVLGDMLELGDHAEQMHAGLADAFDSQAIELVFLVGTQMTALFTALTKCYQPEQTLFHYSADQLPELAQDLRHHIAPGDEVLLKASHGMHLEKILTTLTSPDNE